MHSFLKHAFGAEYSENVDLTDWTTNDLTALAVGNGFKAAYMVSVRETLAMRDHFKVFGTYDPADREPAAKMELVVLQLER